MKVLVYGHAGWIGSQFVEILKKNNINYILGTVRVDDTSSLLQELDTILPSHVVSFIGRTHGKIGEKVYPTIDYLENPGKLVENVRDNLFSPIVLALLAQKHNIHYTYMGTGCIFTYNDDELVNMCDRCSNSAVWVNSGAGTGAGCGAGVGTGAGVYKFTEEDHPNFFGSSYSTVKGYTDRLMHLFPNVLNVRIRMPITADYNPRNFITKILKYKKICSVQNSMSVLPELLPIMVNMAERGRTGTINLVNPGTISHNEILYLYKLYIDPTFTWSNFTIEEQQKVLDAGRSNNHLDTTALETDYDVLPIHDAITTVLTKMRE